MSETFSDSRSGVAFGRECLVALPSLLQKQFGTIDFACLVSTR